LDEAIRLYRLASNVQNNTQNNNKQQCQQQQQNNQSQQQSLWDQQQLLDHTILVCNFSVNQKKNTLF